jgi:uncharacterized protein YdeI (YjbR/CyaY-like superfamily)
MDPQFFMDGTAFRRGLAKHHASHDALWVGLVKKHSSSAGLRYADAVNEALCYGWIDGQARRIDADRYMIRFSPRRARSVWSAVNIRKYEALAAAGRVEPAGEAAFVARDPARSGVYSYEQTDIPVFEPEQESRFRKAKRAWSFFTGAAPSYQRTARHWVLSARKAETRERRLARLIECSAAGERLPHLTPRDTTRRRG